MDETTQTTPASATAGEGASGQPPAAPQPEAPGAEGQGEHQLEGQQPEAPTEAPQEQPTEQGAEQQPAAGQSPAQEPTGTAPTEAPPEPEPDPEAIRRQRELEAREYEIERRELVAQLDEADRKRDAQSRQALMYDLAKLDTEFQERYTRAFAQEHGVDPNHPELRKTRNRSEFEAKVYKLAAASAREQLQKERQRLKALQADLPATVKAQVQKELAAAGVTKLDAGAGAHGGKVINWHDATAEQVRRMEEELARRR